MAEVVETLLNYKVDQGSVAQAVAANERVALSLQEAQEAAASVGLTTEAFLSRTGAVIVEQEAAATAIRGAAEATRELTTETEAAAASQQKLATSGGGISAQRFGSRVAGLGSIVGSSGGAGFRDVSQLVMLGSAFGAVGVGAGVLALGLKAVTDAEQKAAEGAKAYIDALEGVTGQTTEEIKQQIEAEQARSDALKDSQATLKDFSDRIEAQNQANREGIVSADEYTTNLKNINAELYDFTGGALGVKNGLGTAAAGAGDFNAILGNTQDAIIKSGANISFLNTQLDSDATAAANAAKALQAHDERLLATSQAAADADKLTSDERQKKIAGMQDEIERYQGLIRYGGLSQETIDDLNLKIQDLTDAQKEYGYVLESQADIVERLNRQAEGISQMMDAITIEVEAEEDLRKARQKLADDTAEQARDLERIRDDEADKESEDRAKTADAEEKALRSHLEKLADIQDRYNLDSEDAIGNRDAVALDKAKKTRDKALKDENESYDDRLDDLQKALDEQLRADQAAAQKQIRNTIEKWERIEAEDQRAIDQSIVDVQNANATIEAITQTNYSGLEIAAVNHSNNMIGIAEFTASMIESRFSQVFQNITGGSGASQVVGQAVEDTLWVLLRSAGIIS